MAGMFELFLDADSRYRFRLSARNGAVIAVSRGFADKPAAVAGIGDARECAGTALIADLSLRGGPAAPAEGPVRGAGPRGTAPAAAVTDLKAASGPEVAEYCPDVLLVIGEAGTIMYLNAAAETLFGYRKEWLLGRHYGTIVPGRFQRHNDWIREAFECDSRNRQLGADLDLFGLRRDGTEFPMEVNLAPLNVAGRAGVVVSIRDVTERKLSDTALREALSLVTATLESTADGILVVTTDGRIAGANERFASMWRIPADLLGSHDDGILMSFVLDQLADPDAFVTTIHELYADPGAESLDLLHFSDGRAFERYSRPQRVAEAIVGRIWSFRDITACI